MSQSDAIIAITSIPQLWQEALNDRAELPFLNIATAEDAQFLKYRARTFFRRASRIATGLTELLGKVEGGRVAIMVDDDHDFSLLLHGVWSAGITAVPISLSFSDSVIVGLLNNSATQTVVFSFAAAARVAGLFGRLATVQHWIVTGGSGRAPIGAGIKRLDELTAGVGNDPFDLELGRTACAEGERAALLILSGGLGGGAPHGIEFNHRQLLQAAQNAAKVVALAAPDVASASAAAESTVSIASLLPKRSFGGLLFSQLVPLLGGGSGVLGTEFETRDFWEQMQLNGVQCAVIDQQHLRAIVGRGKSRAFGLNAGMRIVVVPSGLAPFRLFESAVQQFNVPVVNTYFQTEAGGVITAARYHQSDLPHHSTSEVSWISSTGSALPGVELIVVDQAGSELAAGLDGEIVVGSAAAMTGYRATAVGEVFVDSGEYLHTGDTGVVVKGEGSKKANLVVTGRALERVVRGDQIVNLALVSAAVYEIRGVQSARVVAFENAAVGFEIGVFVVANRAAGLTEASITSSLAKLLPASHVPRVVLFGMTLPSLEVTLERFKPYAKMRF